MGFLTWWKERREQRARVKQKTYDDRCEKMPCFKTLSISKTYGYFCPACNHAGGFAQVGEFDVNVFEIHKPHGKIKEHHAIWKCNKCSNKWVMLIRDDKPRTLKRRKR